MESEGGRRSGCDGCEAAALNVILRRNDILELDRRPGAGSGIVVIVVAGGESGPRKEQNRSECGEKVLFFHS